jgi:hypothetical protein
MQVLQIPTIYGFARAVARLTIAMLVMGGCEAVNNYDSRTREYDEAN